MGADLAPEEQFGPYVVYERLGVGGMATVHRALERGIEGFERIVALKRLLPHLAEDASFIKSFVREAKLASLLNHNNIVQIFELGRVGAEYFISMEYIDGRDIRQILRHARKVTGPPPLNVSVGLLLQLCEALDYAHTKVDEAGQPLGLVHRDVSPSNLLVTSAGHLKVIDFGIAKAQSQQLRTQTGRVKGKLAYMAPEAISGSRDLDARSDLFAAGVIAHELLTARPLFASKNEYQTLLKVQRGDIMPPSTFNPTVPPELDAIVLKALARDADDRYESAIDLRDALLRVKHQQKLATGHRDLSGWLAYAFSQSAPAPGDASQSLVISESTVKAPAKRAVSQRTDDEDAAVEVAWGGGDDQVSGEVVLLDEVPDVSDKHLAIPSSRDSVDDLDDDIPRSRPSDGAIGRAITPRPTGSHSIPAGLPRPGSASQPGATRATGSQRVVDPTRPRSTESETVVGRTRTAPIATRTPPAGTPLPVGPAPSVPMPAGSRLATGPVVGRSPTDPALARTPTPNRSGGRTVPPRVAAATMPPPVQVSSPAARMTGSMARIDPAELADLVEPGPGASANDMRAAMAELDAAEADLEVGLDPAGTLMGTEPSDTAPSLPVARHTPRPGTHARLTPVPVGDRPTPRPSDSFEQATTNLEDVSRLSDRPTPQPTPRPSMQRRTPTGAELDDERPRAAERPTPRPSDAPVTSRGTGPAVRPSMPPSLGEHARMSGAVEAATELPSLVSDAVPRARNRSGSAGLATGSTSVPRTKPGVAPARASTTSVAPNRATPRPVDSRPVTRPVTMIGSAIIERQTVKRTWVVVLGVAVVGGAAAGAAYYLTRDHAPQAKVEAPPAPVLPGKVKFDTKPADAEITIEGYPVHAGSPWSMQLPPGTYPVRITREGYKTWETALELSSQETSSLVVVLEPAAADGVTDSATLSLASTPDGLEALVDGVKLPSLTPVKTTLAPGSHVIVLRQRGVDVWKRSIVAQANADYEFAPSMAAEKIRERALRDRARGGDETPAAITPPTTPHITTTTPPPTTPTPPPRLTPAPPVDPKTGKPYINAATGQPYPPGTMMNPATGKPYAASAIDPKTGRPYPGGVAPQQVTRPTQPVPETVTPPTIAPPVVPPTKPVTPPTPPVEHHYAPVTVAPTAVKKLSGDALKVGSSHKDEVPAVVSAKVCIDPTGAVTDVTMITKLERITMLDFTSSIKTWKYSPYKKAGTATPACFVVSFRVK